MQKEKSTLGLNCSTCHYGNLCLAKTLTEEEKALLNKILHKIQILPKNTHIYRKNEKMNYLYAVNFGYCKDYSLDENGNESIANFYFPGDILGLESLSLEPEKAFTHPIKNHLRKYLFSAITLTNNVRLCPIPIEPFLELISKSSNILRRFISILSYKMKNDKQMRPSTNAKRRVADFLLTTLYRFEERRLFKGRIHLMMSQFDISNLLGMAYETVNRVLHNFQNQHIIHIANKQIDILDLKQLRQIASPMENYGQA